MLENENPVLVGIASWGYGCPKGRPKGIYTNVSNYIRFVIFSYITIGATSMLVTYVGDEI